MSKNSRKGFRNGSRKKFVKSLQIEKIPKAVRDVALATGSVNGLSLKPDKATRRKIRALEELKARVERMENQELPSTKGSPVSDDKEFKHIIENEVKRKKDLAVWKSYSKCGGIGDILTDIIKAVEHPSVNAFEFDEEEGMYIIFITLNNTYISRLTDLCSGMCGECEEIAKTEDGGMKKESESLQEEKELLQKIYNDLITEKERILNTEGQKQEKELKELERAVDSYEQRSENYIGDVNAYQERLEIFSKECEQLQSYVPRYDTLFEKLTELGKIFREEHQFHRLTVSPAGEEELERYMETAHEFSIWALRLTEEYLL